MHTKYVEWAPAPLPGPPVGTMTERGTAVPVKHGILALLAESSAHGYQLKADFEQRTGGAWELNIGQVYTTLQRLERDGLVRPEDDDEDDRRTYAITPAGRAALATWYGTPIVAMPPPRDELAIKVLLAVASSEVDVHAVIQRQRTAVLEHLQALTRRKRGADPVHDLAVVLHLDALVLRAEAEIRWLETCETRLRQHPATARPPWRDAASEPAEPARTTSDRAPQRPTGATTDDRPLNRASGGRP
jgi:DNA-binding PadR family transcriptional regulator